MPDFKDYMYQTGEGDEERLSILNEVYNPYAQTILLEQSLSKKKAVLEIACGQGELVCWLAEQAPQAIVVGVDISGKQLELAKEKASRKRLKNLYFVEISALDLDLLPNKLHSEYGIEDFHPDLIYSRWLLVHLHSEGRRIVAEKVYKLLAEDGCAVYEEVTLKQSYTHSEAYKKWIDLFERLGRKIDVDFDLGDSLEYILSEVGYFHVATTSVKPVFSENQLRFFNIDLRCTKDLLIREKICSAEELERLEIEIASDLASGKEMTMVNVQAIGRRT